VFVFNRLLVKAIPLQAKEISLVKYITRDTLATIKQVLIDWATSLTQVEQMYFL
jgi:hypothetical protein